MQRRCVHACNTGCCTTINAARPAACVRGKRARLRRVHATQIKVTCSSSGACVLPAACARVRCSPQPQLAWRACCCCCMRCGGGSDTLHAAASRRAHGHAASALAWRAAAAVLMAHAHARALALALVRSVCAQKYWASMLELGSCSTASEVDQASTDSCHCSSQLLACALTLGSGCWYRACRAAASCCETAMLPATPLRPGAGRNDCCVSAKCVPPSVFRTHPTPPAPPDPGCVNTMTA